MSWSQISNTNNKPCQLHLVYLGPSDITLDDPADVLLRLTAPAAAVILRAKFDYYGALRAKEVTVSNLAGIHYDESCNDRVVTGMKFIVRKQGEIYR